MFTAKKIYIIHPARSAQHYRALVGWHKYKIVIMGFAANPLRHLSRFKLRRFFYALLDQLNWFILQKISRDQIIIWSLEAFSDKVKQIVPLAKHHQLIYQTSWAGWSKNDFIFSGTPEIRETWLNLLKKIKVVTVTENSQKQLQGILKSGKNVFHIPHSVNYEIYRHCGEPKAGILFVGRFSLEKNFDFIKKIIEAFPQQKFTFVGCGEELNKINDYSNVTIHNYVEKPKELAWFFKKAKLLILPSIYELFGMVLLEAMSARTVVISAPNTGPAEIIKHHNNGYLLPLKIEEWIRTIQEILKHDQEQLLNRAEKDIITKYDYHIIRQKWEDLWLKK